MPCNSDYMIPSQTEANKRQVCEHLMYVAQRYSMRSGLHQAVEKGAASIYGSQSISLRQLTAVLCNMLNNIEPERINSDLSIKGIMLALWWAEHVEADNKRIEREVEQQALSKRRADALAKLTLEDKMALGL
jgi:hypothetical protein